MKDKERPEPPPSADERTTLAAFLDFHRATLEWKCDGLAPDQLARRAMLPSTLSLLGIVRHLAEVEWNWFDRFPMNGARRPFYFFTADDLDRDFDGAVADPQLVTEAFEKWRSAVDDARAVTANYDLDATFAGRSGKDISLRWVLVHMIEEYARHNGHADLLREAIDGQTGE